MGQEDGGLIEIPRGGPRLRASWRPFSVGSRGVTKPDAPVVPRGPGRFRRPSLIATAILVLCTGSAGLVSPKWGNTPSRPFWHAFLHPPPALLVLFTHPR